MDGDGVEVPRPTSRRTRSQAAPEWTAQEVLTLANEVAAVEEDCRRALSSFQRWGIVAANCTAILGGPPLSAHRCRRKWDAVVADCRRIRAWEGEEGRASYWSLDAQGRSAARLPADLDWEVFAAVARSIRALERGADAGDVESESDRGGVPAVMDDDDDDDDVVVVKEISGSRKAMQGKSSETAKMMQDMAHKLQVNAQHVHAILSGKLNEDDATEASPPADLRNVSSVGLEFRRRQADELIRTLGSLISTLDHFTDLAEGNMSM